MDLVTRLQENERALFGSRQPEREILKAWSPSPYPGISYTKKHGAVETPEDYTTVQPIPGLSVEATDKRLASMGLSRADVLISAKARYYWVGLGPCPFETGPNNEISRHEFENVRGLR